MKFAAASKKEEKEMWEGSGNRGLLPINKRRRGNARWSRLPNCEFLLLQTASSRYLLDMKNINLSVDDATLEKVQRLAQSQNTSVAALVNDYLSLLTQVQIGPNEAIARILQLSASACGEMGPRTWSRADLYDR